MKTDLTFSKNIKEAAQFCESLNMLRTMVNANSLSIGQPFSNLTMNKDTPYYETFVFGLCNSIYNFSLDDNSFLQFSMYKRNRDYFYRYGYYPNPFENYTEYYTTDIVDKETSDYQIKKHNIVPIRYDYDCNAYRTLRHSESHFHFGLHNNRVPLDKLITPLLFTIFIVKTFYIENWTDSDIFDENDNLIISNSDTTYSKELALCRQSKFYCTFTKEDKQQLFFT